MQRVWIVLVVGCYTSPSPSSPAGTAGTGSSTTAADDAPAATPSARAALDGLLQIQPEAMCGGAMQPEDYRPPPLAPAPNVKLVVTAGKRYDGSAPVAEVVTGKDGTFTAQLKPGMYCITRAGRGARPKQGGKYLDVACLVKRWETCDAVAEVPVKTVVAIDIIEPCRWAVCYSGPPPP